MIPLTSTINLHDWEIQERFIRSPGPGGQNVNKVASGVQLRFDVARSPTLPAGVKRRLMRIAGRKLSNEGILIIDAHRFRARELNREDARQRLIALIREALRQPKARKKTKPTLASRQRRLESKRRQAQLKRMRRGPSADD